jgi:hypothetical protein
MAYFNIGCRVLLVAVFLVAALSKLRSRSALEGFLSSIRALDLLPPNAAGPAAAVVIAGELAVPALLAVPATVLAGFAVAIIISAAFMVVILGAIRSGRQVPCGCFGISTQTLGMPHVVRDAVLLAAAVAGGFGSARLGTSELDSAGMAVSLAAAGICAVLLIGFDDLVELFGAGRPAVQ